MLSIPSVGSRGLVDLIPFGVQYNIEQFFCNEGMLTRSNSAGVNLDDLDK